MRNIMRTSFWNHRIKSTWDDTPTSEYNEIQVFFQCIKLESQCFIAYGVERVCNSFFRYFRVLLRVRMLYYIKHEVIGDLVQQITDGAVAR